MTGFVLIVSAVLAAAAPSAAEQVWPPPVPALDFGGVAARPVGEALDEKVLSPGLSLLITHDVTGLGVEAARAEAWRAGRSGVRIAGGRRARASWTLGARPCR